MKGKSLSHIWLYTVHGILQARILEWVAVPFSRIEPRSPTLQMDFLPAEPQGKSYMNYMKNYIGRTYRKNYMKG